MKFKASCDFSEQVSVFDTLPVFTVDVVAAGTNALACLYNGRPGNGLNSLSGGEVERNRIKSSATKLWMKRE